MMRKSLRAKTFAMVLAFGFVLSFISIYVSFRVHSNTMQQEYQDFTQSLANTESMLVDPDLLETYAVKAEAIYKAYVEKHGGPPDLHNMSVRERTAYYALFNEIYEMDGYREMQESLRELALLNDARYMYITLTDLDNEVAYYIMDASLYGNATPIGWIESIHQEHLIRLKNGYEFIPPFVTHYPEYGWLCTAVARITSDTTGHVIADACVDVSMNAVMTQCYKYLLNITVMLAVITLCLMPLCLFSVDKLIVHPIKKIARAAYIFVSARQNNENIFASLNIKNKDEIGRLSSSMQTMENEINEYIHDIRSITAEKERVGAELHIATEIQANMLPSIFPAFPDNTEFDIYATMNPAKEVGGDFYDFFFVDDKHLALVMADVSGKGVPAALFMVVAKTLMKNRAQAGGSPAQVLADVNAMLCENNRTMLFVTVWIAIIDVTTGKGIAANAGHEDPVIRRANGDFELVKYRHSPAVAVMDSVKFREHEFELFPGDRLFVYTDGVPEATNLENELYGSERMLAALNANKDLNLQSLLTALRKNINNFVGDAPQFDDITMLGFDFYGQGGAQS